MGGNAVGERLVRVGVSEFAVASGEAVLSTSGLGSCVGVALRDEESGVAGLLHAMLPSSNSVGDNPAKFVDTGLPALLEAMEDAGADPTHVEAKLVGASRMLEFSGEQGAIGERNVETTDRALSDLGIQVVARDVGGSHGRSVRFEVASGDLHVKTAYAGDTVI